MSDAVLDFSGLETAAPAASVDSAPAAVETSTPETSTTQTDITTPAPPPSDASEKSPADASVKDDPKGSIGSPTPQDVHKALQAFKDSDPEKFGAMAKSLNNVARREFEYAKTFGSVTEAKEVSSLLREVAGIAEGQPLTAAGAREAIDSLRGVKAAAEASDAKLYEPAQNAQPISDV